MNARLENRRPIPTAQTGSFAQRRTYLERKGMRLARLDYVPDREQGPHDHDYASLTLILRGGCREFSEDGTHDARGCSVLVKPEKFEHANGYGRDGMLVFQIAFVPSAFPGAALRYQLLEGGPAVAAMLSLLRLVAASAPIAEIERRTENTVQLICAPAASIRTRNPPAWSKQIPGLLNSDAPSRISVKAIAESTGMHPVSFARAFRRHYGCCYTEYVRRRRVVEACRLITAESHSLADIAAACGFADQSHFTRAFHAELACTPGDFRRVVR